MPQLGLLSAAAAAAAASAATTCDFNIHHDVSCTFRAFKWTNETSFAACCADCAATEGCHAWEWSAHEEGGHAGNCHQKAQPGNGEKRVGTTCGISKSIPQPPLPPPPPAPLPLAPPAKKGSPNIVWFLTDDQVRLLGNHVPVVVDHMCGGCQPFLCSLGHR